MGVFFRKDFLIYWRDRKEMLIALMMPIVLIVVLSFAMPNWFGGETDAIHMTVGLVVEDDAEAGVSAFKASLRESGMAEEEAAALAGAADAMNPTLLLRGLLGSEALREIVDVVETDSAAAIRHLEEDEWTAIVTIPQGYTEAGLAGMLLGEGEAVPLQLTAGETSLELDVLRDILAEYMRSVNFGLAIDDAMKKADSPPIPGLLDSIRLEGGMEQLDGFRTITSSQYFTLAISVLFSLFMAMTTATKAMTEKREQVFQRILLTGAKPGQYIAGKAMSTFCLTLLQAAVAFLVSHFVFDLFAGESLSFWLVVTLLLIVYCIVISGLAAIFTSISFRMKDETAGGLMTAIIMVFGTLGGGFVPVYLLPDVLRKLGEWAPNGIILKAYTDWIQQGLIADVVSGVMKLLIFAVLAFVVSIALFPRKGRI